MNKVELIKLNKNYQSDPNTAYPGIKIDRKSLILSFELNYFAFDFKEDQMGEIIFNNCYSYRLGGPNDEGFYLNQNKFWNKNNFSDLQWDCFYEVKNTPKIYLEKFKVINPEIGVSKIKLNHYVFFMKEGTFECLAEFFKENLIL